MKHLIFAFIFIPVILYAQHPEQDSVRKQSMNFPNESVFIVSDTLFNESGIINLGSRDGWRFHPGDDLSWADPDFDDSDWMSYKPAGLTEPIPDSLWDGHGWFRYRFAADSSAYAMVKNLYFFTRGAAEVYLDGKLVYKFGAFSTDLQGERRYTTYDRAYPPLIWHPSESHVLAVRFSYHKGKHYKKLLGKYASAFGFGIGLTTDQLNQNMIIRDGQALREFYILGTMLLLVVLLHGFLFILFPAERSNLHITIVAFLIFLHIIVSYGSLFVKQDVLQLMLFRYIPFIFVFYAVLSMLPFTLNSIFKQKPRMLHKLLIWLFPVVALANFILSGPSPNVIIAIGFASVILFFSSQVLIKAWRNKLKGVWIVAVAFLCLILSAVAFVVCSRLPNYSDEFHSILMYLIYGSIPLGLTVFMASRFRDLYTGLENKVRERTQALQQSLEDLRSTQTQLIHTEKMASLGALTAGIAHEIQNPLNFVNNFSEVNTELIDEALDENEKGNNTEVKLILNDLKENESKIIHHGRRAESIVNGMLLHSRGSSGHKEPTDINALCDEYLRLSYHGFRAKDKTFNADYKTNFDPNLPKINVIPQDIGRVLLNLINNAFYAVHSLETQHAASLQQTPDYKPMVMISTKYTGTHVEIHVKDNGQGIPEEIKDKIFQPFFTTKPTGQGTGLGLSLAYDIVKAHGGEIRIETIANSPLAQTIYERADARQSTAVAKDDGQGTEFIIHLPLN
jgi:two-component system, NtrC family, sensor kinase